MGAATPTALWKRAIAEQGLGHKPDSKEVTHWLLQAALAGHRDACHHLLGRPAIEKKKMLSCLSKHEDPQSQFALGKTYISLKDKGRGVVALKRAAMNGFEPARELLARFTASQDS